MKLDYRRWAFMQRHVIEDIYYPDDKYLTRIRLIQTPWFGIYLHIIHRHDSDRALHNHPWTFTGIVLCGGYDEEWAPTPGQALTEPITRRHPRFSRVGVKLSEFHSVRTLYRIPTWTLCFTGRRKQEWGFVDVEWDETETVGKLVVVPHAIWVHCERVTRGVEPAK